MADEIRNAFAFAWRDNVIDHVPASGAHEPRKSDIRTVGDIIQNRIDVLEQGIRWTTNTVRVRATANVDIATALENGDTLNGVTLATGNVVFLPSQSSAAQNGLYEVQASGAAVRVAWANSAAELARIGFVIREGTAGAGERWVLPLNESAITVGSTALTFALYGIDVSPNSEVVAARDGYTSLSARLGSLADVKVAGAVAASGVNGFRDRFGPAGTPVVSPYIHSDGSLTYEKNATIDGVMHCPAVIKAQRAATVVPGLGADSWIQVLFWCPRADLEALGWTPGGTISMRVGLVDRPEYVFGSNFIVFFGLRYGDTKPDELLVSTRVTTDVAFRNVTTTVDTGYLGFGDGSTFAGQTAGSAHVGSDAAVQYKRTGIPAPDTYDGKDFAGAWCAVWALMESSGTTVLEVMPPVVVVGDTLPADDDVARNSRDDILPPVNVSDRGLSPLGAEDAGKRITAENCAKLVFFEDSLGQYIVGPAGKHAMDLISARTDWPVVNLSKSGADAVELAAYLMTDTNDHDGRLGFRDMKGSVCLISTYGNDSFAQNNRNRHYFENLRQLVLLVQAAGCDRVVLLSEGRHNRATHHMALGRLAREMGIEFWDISNDLYQLEPATPTLGTATRDEDYWGDGGHPGVRAQHLVKDAVLDRLPLLGRPPTGLKLYRERDLRSDIDPLVSVQPLARFRFDGESLASDGSDTSSMTLNGGATLVLDPDHGWVMSGSRGNTTITFPSGSYTKHNLVKRTSHSGVHTITAAASTTKHEVYFSGTNLICRHGSSTEYINWPWPYAVDTWHWVTTTYDADRQILRLYVDGDLKATATSVPAHGGTSYVLGAYNVSSNPFVGYLGEAHVYSECLEARLVKRLARHRDALAYDSPEERCRWWMPLGTGHRHLPEDVRPYFDQVPLIGTDHGGFAPVNAQSEYMSLMKGEAISFRDRALCEVIIDATARSLRVADLTFDADSDVRVFVRRRQKAFSFSASGKQVDFALSGYVYADQGAVYRDGASNDFTVVGVWRNEKDRDASQAWSLWCAPPGGNATVSTSSGTLTKQSGNGQSMIDYNARYTGASGVESEQRYGPYGDWVEVTNLGGRAVVKGPLLLQSLKGDKLEILFERVGTNFTLANVGLTRHGGDGKSVYVPPRVTYPASGTQVLVSRTIPSSLSGTSWEAVGSAAPEVNPDDWKPAGVDYVCLLDTVKRLRQPVPIDPGSDRGRSLIIRVRARSWFAKFEPDEDEEVAALEYDRSSWSYRDSADELCLAIDLVCPSGGNYASQIRYAENLRRFIGPAWRDHYFEIPVPAAPVWNLGTTPGVNAPRMEIFCDSDVGQICLGLADAWLV
jgi:hypothetical protein